MFCRTIGMRTIRAGSLGAAVQEHTFAVGAARASSLSRGFASSIGQQGHEAVRQLPGTLEESMALTKASQRIADRNRSHLIKMIGREKGSIRQLRLYISHARQEVYNLVFASFLFLLSLRILATKSKNDELNEQVVQMTRMREDLITTLRGEDWRQRVCESLGTPAGSDEKLLSELDAVISQNLKNPIEQRIEKLQQIDISNVEPPQPKTSASGERKMV